MENVGIIRDHLVDGGAALGEEILEARGVVIFRPRQMTLVEVGFRGTRQEVTWT